MKDIELHIFTNSGKFSPKTDLIKTTYNSFCETFGNINDINVWCDSNPNTENSNAYVENLKSIFPKVHTTVGLADGYSRAVTQSKSKFMFMLEHDWEFISGRINHSLSEICEIMEQQKIMHMRFNKRKTIKTRWDFRLSEVDYNGFKYCVTPCVSNNPHIILTEKYRKDALSHIKVSKDGKSEGIEDILSLKVKKINGTIYGPIRYEPTVSHLDGTRNPTRWM